jgi:peptide methionine sulfoxide reductase msrA/msrB
LKEQNKIDIDKVTPITNRCEQKKLSETAIFAGGCFWGVEYYLQRIDGVKSTEVGYIGGDTINPTYKDVCSHTTGPAEAVRSIFDPKKVSFETLLKHFFELHDPTQHDRQGPDVGTQYRSEVFYTTSEQKKIAEKIISLLRELGYDVATKISLATTFWEAENYHQDYYNKKESLPYCHGYVKRF